MVLGTCVGAHFRLQSNIQISQIGIGKELGRKIVDKQGNKERESVGIKNPRYLIENSRDSSHIYNCGFLPYIGSPHHFAAQGVEKYMVITLYHLYGVVGA